MSDCSKKRPLTCVPHLQSALANYVDGLVQTFGDGLVGVYLYGSLARGCYHPSTSDVDIIAVISDNCAAPDDSLILSAHSSKDLLSDPVFVTDSQLHADVFPAPVVCLVKRMSMKPVADCRVVRKPEGCRDFLLQRQDAYEAGIALFGPSPRDLIRPVPWPLLADSLDYLFPYILHYFKNPVLMLARIVYAWNKHKLCSKRQAGEWAIATIGEQWVSVIEIALAEYSSGAAPTSIPQDTLQAFEQRCGGLIAQLR